MKPYEGDSFYLGRGEPERRDITKINGLPYRRRDKPWPLDDEGKPYTFVFQVRLTESRRFIKNIRRDFLLVFGNNPFLDDVRFEWVDAGLDSLVTPDEVPEPSWSFFHGYGLRFPTVNYSGRRNSRGGPGDYCEAPIMVMSYYRTPWELSGVAATICVRRFSPCVDVPYPWVNQIEPISGAIAADPALSLSLGDREFVFFHIMDDGRIEIEEL